MRLGASLGNITFRDELADGDSHSDERDILTIEGQDLANLTYETYDPADHETFPGYNSFVKLRSGSLKVLVSPRPLQHLSAFLTKLARLKAVYDAASQAAMQRASEVVRMRYDVEVKTPILVLPRLGVEQKPGDERVIVRLGQVAARNEYFKDRPQASAIDASLTGISIASESLIAKENMPILADVDLRARIEQLVADGVAVQEVYDETKVSWPAQTKRHVEAEQTMQVVGKSNDIVMTLTQSQYRLIMAILRELPAALSECQDDQSATIVTNTGESTSLVETTQAQARAEKPIGPVPSSLSVQFNVPAIRLELFDAKAISKATLDGHSIIRFEIDDVASTFDKGVDGSQSADVKLAAVTLSNTRPGASLYRDFLPRSTSGESQM